MSEIERYKQSFSQIHASEAMLSEVRKMTEKRTTVPRVSRKVLALAAVLALLLVLSASAAAAHTLFGWGGNMEIRSTRTDTGIYNEVHVHTDSLVEPVEFRDGRMLFIVNGEHIDITDQVSETRAFLYSYTDEEGVRHYWAVGKNGPEPEHYGYAEYLYREGESWLGGYVARTNNNDAPWLRDAKARMDLPW